MGSFVPRTTTTPSMEAEPVCMESREGLTPERRKRTTTYGLKASSTGLLFEELMDRSKRDYCNDERDGEKFHPRNRFHPCNPWLQDPAPNYTFAVSRDSKTPEKGGLIG
jgi:hypothetical protein